MRQGFRMELLSLIIFFFELGDDFRAHQSYQGEVLDFFGAQVENRSWILRVKHRGRSSIRGWCSLCERHEGSNWRPVEEDRVQQIFQRFVEGIGAEAQGGLSDDSQVPCFCSYLSSSRL